MIPSNSMSSVRGPAEIGRVLPISAGRNGKRAERLGALGLGQIPGLTDISADSSRL